MSSNAKDVKVKLKVQHYKIIPFVPGSWNVKVNGLMAKLEAKPLVMIQKGGGGISVFGFRIGASGSSSENSSHGNTWNSSSGILTINSENPHASANVLAAMGEIVGASRQSVILDYLVHKSKTSTFIPILQSLGIKVAGQ